MSHPKILVQHLMSPSFSNIPAESQKLPVKDHFFPVRGEALRKKKSVRRRAYNVFLQGKMIRVMSAYWRITWQMEVKQQNPAQTLEGLVVNCTAAVQQQPLELAKPLLYTSRNINYLIYPLNAVVCLHLNVCSSSCSASKKILCSELPP